MFRKKPPAPQALPTLAPRAVQIVGNLMVLTDGQVIAGYRLPTERWEFTGEAAKTNLLDAHAEGFANLAAPGGRTFHERVTTRPFPVQEWARRLDLRTPQPLPDVHHCEPGAFSEGQMAVGECGCETWNGLLARWQHRIARNGLADKWVYRYFGVGRVKPGKDVRRFALTPGLPDDKEIRAVLTEERAVAEIVTTWGAKPMTEHQQAWLRQRSLAPGILLPTPPGEGGWDADSLPSLASDVVWEEAPFDRAVTVNAWLDGQQTEVAVQVLTVARLDEMAYPSNGLEPWQTFAERAVDTSGVPFTVEWSISGRLHPGSDLESAAEVGLRRAINLQRDYNDHREPAPQYTERGIAAAARIRDEVTTGHPVAASRFRGTIDAIVVAGPVLAEDGRVLRPAVEVVEERAAALRRLYSAPPLRMEMALVHPQSVKLRSTVPGEAPEDTASQRQVPLPYLTAGLPSAAAAVGDDAGPYIGYTRGAARRAVMHDPHFATEGRGSLGRGQNLWVVSGTLGSGKSVLTGHVAYEAARRGANVVVSDPSGPLAALCDLPELKPFARKIDLTTSPDGSLSPAALVRQPTLEEYAGPGDPNFIRAIKRAEAERGALLFDAARRCLSPDLYFDRENTLAVLTAATAGKPWSQHASMWDLVTTLREMADPHAERIARALEVAASQPLFSLLFTEPGAPAPDLLSSASFTVVSTPGIQRPPDNVERWDWSTGEAGADLVLRLGAFYTDRLIYGKPRDQRAVAIFDEAESLTDSAAGRGFLSRLGRDHSKWNIGVYLAVKSISQAMMGEEIRNFIAGAFVGRMANEGAAEQMLDILNITDKRYARTLMRLSEVAPGEFVHLDATGRVAAIRVDVDYHPALKAALLTDPAPAGAEAWHVQEAL